MRRKLGWSFSFKWYDLWVGFYYDRKGGSLYFCPLPMCVFEFWWEYHTPDYTSQFLAEFIEDAETYRDHPENLRDDPKF